MLFVVRFHDKPGHAALRARWLAAHVDWVAAHPQVRVAGSLRETPDAAPVGGLWIVEAATKADVHALMASDPFFAEGLRERVEVLHWSKALDGPATV